jgi:hypothetical protein
MLRSIGWIAASLLVCPSAGHCWAGQSFWLQTGGSRELCQNDLILPHSHFWSDRFTQDMIQERIESVQ